MLEFTDHPIIKGPTPEEIVQLTTLPNGEEDPDGYDKLIAWNETHEEAIENAEKDPYNYGAEFPSWHLVYEQLTKWYEVIIFGGNGSSKSRIGAYLVVDALLNNPGALICCFAQDDSASRTIQQRYIYDYLPPKYKKKKTSSKGYLKYSMHNGFTGEGFIIDLEDGSEPRECKFFKYSQYQMKKSKFEGYEYGSRTPGTHNIGAWLDEYLENGDLYETLLYRIPRRDANILTTFTPIDHMTPFVADKIKGSEITKTIETNPEAFHKESDPKEVEWVREKRNNPKPKGGIGMVFFPSEHNPWAGFDSMVALHSHKSIEERLVRFHGVPSRITTKLLPLFNMGINVLSDKPNKHGMTFPNIRDKRNYTTYQIVDPGGNKNYASIWAAVDEEGSIFVRREWPDRETYGEWAIFGDPSWKLGSAAKKLGLNVQAYVDLFKKIEEELGVTPFERIGDSRFFANENQDNDDLFTCFDDCGMFFVPSDGRKEAIGIAALDEWFHYNPNYEVDKANKPKCFIHEDCGNLIDSLINYNCKGKHDEALKDFFDLMRYLRMHNEGLGPDHMNEWSMNVQKTGKGGY